MHFMNAYKLNLFILFPVCFFPMAYEGEHEKRVGASPVKYLHQHDFTTKFTMVSGTTTKWVGTRILHDQPILYSPLL